MSVQGAYGRPLWRALLLNRFSLSFALIAAAVSAWNIYVARHDDGLLGGYVLGADGAPAAGVEVVLSEQTIVSLTPLMRTVTDAQGRFRFSGHDRHHVVLTAGGAGLGESARYPVRLYFRNQNRELETPLRLVPEG